MFVCKLSSHNVKIGLVQEGYTLYARRTVSQVYTRLTGIKIRAASVLLEYFKGNLESSHAVVYGEVEVQLDVFLT